MASIRRAPSSPSTRHLPPQQNLPPPPPSPPPPPAAAHLSIMDFYTLLFHFRYSRRPWKRYAARYILFFLLGLLLGFFHFPSLTVDYLVPREFSYEIQSAVAKESGRDGDPVVVKLGAHVIKTVEAGSSTHAKGEVSWEKTAAVVEGRKLLIVVTPTRNRALQAYYLARLGQTLRLVPPPLLWIVVEMSAASMETAELLRKTGVMYRHLVCLKNSTGVMDRGIHQRNVALEHIERHQMDGIVYFADDENIYSSELFEKMREVRRFGTWPVAMFAKGKMKAAMEGPLCNGNQIIGWHTDENSKRFQRFHVDTSGFAFNSTLLWDPKRWHRPSSTVRQLDIVEGFQETFIQQLVEDEFQMESVPSDCSKIMNWHLHIDCRGLFYPRGWRLRKNLETVIPL